MPFASQAQQRFAFGTGQPWARRWADETDFSKLPKRVRRIRSKRVKGCTCGERYKGEQIAPGVTRIRGNLCNVHGKYGPCDAALSGGKKPKGGKGRGRAAAKPKKTDAQRAAERDQKRSQNAASVAQQMAANDTGLSPAGSKALLAFATGEQPDAQDAEGFVQMGLAERADDGSYRMTPTGRAVVNAMQAGDYQRAVDGISRATDQANARRGRQAAAAQRRQDTAGRRAQAQIDRELRKREAEQRRAAAAAAKKPASGGGGGKKKPAEPGPEKPSKRDARLDARRPSRVGGTSPVGGAGSSSSGGDKKPAQAKPEQPAKTQPKLAPKIQDAVQRLSDGEELSENEIQQLITNGLVKLNKDGAPVLTAAGQRATKKEFTFSVFKDASGVDRWVTTSSTAYRDRDREIVSSKALQGAVESADASGTRGPLRFWHVPGVELGDCDYQATAQDGRFLIESGTFRSPAIAAAVKAHADDYRMSIGFTHPADEPDAQGVFHNIFIFERSLVPAGRASNPFTQIAVKDVRMLTTEKQAELTRLLGGDESLIQGLLAQVATTDKAAQDGGVAFKETDLRALIRAELASLLTEPAAPSEPSETTEKAAAVPMDEAPADSELDAGEKDDGMEMDGGEPEGDENMLTPAEIQAIAAAVVEALTPLLNIESKMSGYLNDMKGMIGGMSATKDAALAEVKTDLETVKAQVADLSGSAPRILAGGYRPSQAAATVTTDERLKEAQPSADPRMAAFADFLGDLGLTQNAQPGV